MSKILKWGIGLALGACFLYDGFANAADLATKAPAYMAAPATTNWSGLYLSGYGLYGVNFTYASVSAGGVPFADIAASPHGPGVGGAIGYNWQFSPNGPVFGVRADIAYANLQGGGNFQPANLSVANATNYLGDVDAILGLPLSPDGRFLGYIGGGFAFGGAKPNFQVATLQQAAADTSTGWNALAGLGYRIAPNWTLFMEGDYFQLGDRSLTIVNGGVPIATSLTKYHIFTQKFGVNFNF